MSSSAAARSAWRATLVVLAAAAWLGAWQHAEAQDVRLVSADSGAPRARPGDVLSRRIYIKLVDVPLEVALRDVARKCDLRLSYSSDIVPVSRRVSVTSDGASVGEVLHELLRETGVVPVVTPSGYVVLVRGVAPYEAVTLNAGVGGGLNTHLVAPSGLPQLMDRVLVMGTPASGAPERELASAVTVVTASHVAAYGAPSMQDLLRTSIPGVVLWDIGLSGPFAHLGSIRGSSSFTANYFKTYVDGVELASPYMLFAIDPYSVERIEVIRGPQGSALYGSDAISGVIQVVTRRGSTSARWRPQFDAMISGGWLESRFVDGVSGTQRHSAMLSTGGGLTSLGLGGTYAEAGSVAPGNSSGTRGVYGGFRHVAGPLRAEGTLRYADIRFTAPENPLFRGRVLANSVRPSVGDQRIENETYGLTLDHQAARIWRQTLVVGIDRNSGAIPQQREPATVADALLGATEERASKSSVRYSSMLRLVDRGNTGGTITLGAEHWNLGRERLAPRSELSVGGEGTAALYRDDVRNTGYFGQLKLDFSRAFFVTAGLRGERNSTFGEDYGTAWSPMVGAVLTRDGGSSTTKFRVAYGKGIRPPAPSARKDIATVNFRQIANPLLEPETQAGIEGGVELYTGDRASLSLTGYLQSANGLIQEVIVNRQTTIQYQNVGRISNSGVEIEGSARRGPVRGVLHFALTDSRVRALSQTYSGDLAVGDRVPEVPGSSGLASVTIDVGRAEVALGTTFIGTWTGYDWPAFLAATSDSTGAAAPELRDYRRTYPSVLKPFLSISSGFHRGIEGFARIDNLTNTQRSERDNLQISAGRTVTLGLRIGR